MPQWKALVTGCLFAIASLSLFAEGIYTALAGGPSQLGSDLVFAGLLAVPATVLLGLWYSRLQRNRLVILSARRPAIPEDMVALLTYYGLRDCYSDPEERAAMGIQTQDTNFLGHQQFRTVAHDDPDQLVSIAANIVMPVGGWAVHGATAWLIDLAVEYKLHDSTTFNAMVAAAVTFLREQRVPLHCMRSYHIGYWLSKGGTVENWLPDEAGAS